MASVPSYLYLHLNCRLRIAELNADINALRIYKDYLDALVGQDAPTARNEEINRVGGRFAEVRASIDELRNDLHLIKMKLGGFVRGNQASDQAGYDDSQFADVNKRLAAFRIMFGELEKEIQAI